MIVNICAAFSSRITRRQRHWMGGGGVGADDRLDVSSLSGPSGTYTSTERLMTSRDVCLVSAVKVEVHSSNSSSGAGSDENLSSSSSDRGSDEPGCAGAGEHDYEDIYEVRHRAAAVGAGGAGGVGAAGVGGHNAHGHHGRGKESKSPSRDSGSHSRSGSMSSTGSGTGGGMAGTVGSSVVVLHTTGHHHQPARVNPSVTNVTVINGGSNNTSVTVDRHDSSSNSIECYESVGAMTPGTYLTVTVRSHKAPEFPPGLIDNKTGPDKLASYLVRDPFSREYSFFHFL